jgi:hypothetical protein
VDGGVPDAVARYVEDLQRAPLRSRLNPVFRTNSP